MKRSTVLYGTLGLTTLALLVACGSQPAGSSNGPVTAQHVDGNEPGGLRTRGAFGAFELVGSVSVGDQARELVADVAAHPGKPYAYLARWGGEQCAGPEKRGQQYPDGGAYVIDLSDPANPREVGFIPVHQDTLVGEGLQVAQLNTRNFKGDVLVMNHESCGKNFKGGFSLVDVTNPLKPVKLAMHQGDTTINGSRRGVNDRNQYHSAFIWSARDRAYLVATDDMESTDVDIFDITNPKHPKLVKELNLNAYRVSQPELGLTDSFLHDMVVKEIGGQQIMLLSYWDGGYVLLNVDDPTNPVHLTNTSYPSVDPELAARGITMIPEGNAHQAEFTKDSNFVIATDEDFDPYRLQLTFGGKSYAAKLGTNTTVDQAGSLAGGTVFVGLACTAGSVPPAGADRIAVVERGGCFFEDKAQNVLAAGGYQGMLIMNREGEDACVATLTPSLRAALPTALIGRDAGFALFGKTFNYAECADSTPMPSGITVPTTGALIESVEPKFDGWGYVQLYAANITSTGATLESLDTFAIHEAMDEHYASGHGDLSVHEVATDPIRNNIAYLSYYNGGMRVVKITPKAGGGHELIEVGGYVHNASSFWGVEVWTHPTTRQQFVLGSDRHSGLKVFRYTGD